MEPPGSVGVWDVRGDYKKRKTLEHPGPGGKKSAPERTRDEKGKLKRKEKVKKGTTLSRNRMDVKTMPMKPPRNTTAAREGFPPKKRTGQAN